MSIESGIFYFELRQYRLSLDSVSVDPRTARG